MILKQQVLIDGWWIRQATEAEKTADHTSFSQVPCADKDGWVFTKNAEQVQKVLLENSLLDERVAVGETERCAWIEQEDWIYRCDFHCDNDFLGQGKRIYLNFKGVDLFADFYLNGEWIGSHDNMLIPKRIEVTGKLQKENHLMVSFYSTRKRMDALFAAMPEEFQRNSKPHCMLRKGQIEFGDAGKVSMINVGLYADVLLEVIDLAEITWPDIETTLDFWHRFADIHYTLHGSGTLGTAYFTTALYSPSGILLHEEQKMCIRDSVNFAGLIDILADIGNPGKEHDPRIATPTPNRDDGNHRPGRPGLLPGVPCGGGRGAWPQDCGFLRLSHPAGVCCGDGE